MNTTNDFNRLPSGLSAGVQIARGSQTSPLAINQTSKEVAMNHCHPSASRVRMCAGLILVLVWGGYANSPLLGQDSSVRTIEGHTKSVKSVAFSPDGKMLASGSEDNTIKLWNAQTGTLLGTLEGHTSDVNSVAFSPDGKMLASGSSDRTIGLWDVQSGSLLGTLKGHKHYVNSVAFSPDGKTLASGSYDRTSKLWNARTGTLLGTLKGPPVTSVAFSPDGKTLVSGSIVDDVITFWNAQAGTLLGTLKGHDDDVTSVTFSPDGKTLASGSRDDTIRLWDARTGRPLATLTGHKYYVNSVAFSPDGETLASGGDDDAVRFWDPQTGTEQGSLKLNGNALCIAFSPNGTTLAAGTGIGGKTIVLIDVASYRSSAPTPQARFEGRWKVRPGPLSLTVDKNKVTGTYAFFDGRVEGQLSRDRRSVKGTWTQSNGASGRFVLTIAPDGTQIEGRRWSGDKTDEETGHDWSGNRIDAQDDSVSARSRGPVEAAASATDDRRLFNGKDLTGWQPMSFEGFPVNDDGWTVSNGTLLCSTSKSGWLMFNRTYGDFELALEFKLPSGANSGVLIRVPDASSDQKTEIQLVDESAFGGHRLQSEQRTGAIWGVVGPSGAASTPVGRWNTLRITCEGDNIAVALNGNQVVEAKMSQHRKLRDLPREGYFGFSNWKGQAQGTAFRNIRVRELRAPNNADDGNK